MVGCIRIDGRVYSVPSTTYRWQNDLLYVMPLLFVVLFDNCLLFSDISSSDVKAS